MWVYCEQKEENCRAQKTVGIGLEQVSSVMKNSRMRRFGHKDDADQIRRVKLKN